MSVASTVAKAVTRHSKLVLVAMLVLTLVVGQGVTTIEEDSSLEQFESETEQSEALAYAAQNFSTTDEPNQTTVQLVATDDNALSQDSLIESLRFQQRLHRNETIEETLVEEDPIVGLANVVATTEIREDDVDDLEARRDDLQADADDLEARKDRLEARADALEERKADLEARAEEVKDGDTPLEEEADRLEERRDELEAEGEELQERADELNRTGERLGDRLNETMTHQQDIEVARVLYENGDINKTEYDRRVSAAEEKIEDVRASATADLNGTQTDRYVTVEGQVRDHIGEFVDLRVKYEQGDIKEEQFEEKNESLTRETRETAEDGIEHVLAEEIESVESERDRLEAERDDLEERGETLQALQSEREELEADADELEAEQEELEADAEDLRDRQRALQADIDDLYGTGLPPLDRQLEALESMDRAAFEETLERVLAGESVGNDGEALQMVPYDHDPDSIESDARVTFITQVADGNGAAGGTTDEDIVESQLELRELADESDANYTVLGSGIVEDDMSRSIMDSLKIVGPFALLLVGVTLVVAYRDPLDIVLGVAGIGTVLVWTFGLMGWMGFSFNLAFVAIPVLLIGLSIDYAIHVFMRYREARDQLGGAITDRPAASDATSGLGDPDDAGTVRGSMTVALAGVGVALAWVTATTVLGLLSNLISPIAPIEEFGFVSAVGIVCAFVIFGTLVPAAKVELDEWLESRGFDRRKRAFGTGGGRLGRMLSIGAKAAVRAPLVVLVLVALVTTAGAVGATQVDTSFEEADFLADTPPEWTDRLPGAITPGEYDGKAALSAVESRFPHTDGEGQLLVEGNLTNQTTLERVADVHAAANESDAVAGGGGDEPQVQSPLATMESVAARNISFNETFHDADTDGDGVPDRNLTAVYDALFAADHEAATNVLHRTEVGGAVADGSAEVRNETATNASATGTGEYEALRVVVQFEGETTPAEMVDELDGLAAAFESGGPGSGPGSPWSVTVTGDDVVTYVMEEDLFRTMLESMVITLVTVLAFTTVGFTLTGRGIALGAVTLAPVALSVSWVLGTMSLLGIPFNVLTAMVTSLTIGLGIDYCIHVTDRYVQELERQSSARDAIFTTVTGTGGALLGSAATAICGFGVLVFTLVPMLRQFGTVTALSIGYAFLASVLVLPTLLVLWTRYGDASAAVEPVGGRPTATADGGETERRTRGQRHKREERRGW